MRIIFVVIGVESLAAEYLCSYIKGHGHEAEIVYDSQIFTSELFRKRGLRNIFNCDTELIKEILLKKPDIIGFPVFSVFYQRALELTSIIKKLSPKIPIMFGGIHPTSVPDMVIKEKNVDIVCVGEGEGALLDLLDSYKEGRKNLSIRNLWFKREGKIIKNPLRSLIDDLNKVPFPDKTLFYKTQPRYCTEDYVCLSSRGCPFACTYCGNGVLQNVYRGIGRHNRRRCPENVIDELAEAKRLFSPKRIIFDDDVFVQDEDWLRSFTVLYKKKIRLPYFALTHARFLNLKMAEMLKESGCYLVEFGIQTASEKTRTKILNRFETNEQIRKAAHICHQVGLDLAIDHIFNLPGEKLKEQIESLRFYNELRPSLIFYFDLQYYPRTEIVEIAKKQGLLTPEEIRKLDKGILPLCKKNKVNENIKLLFNILPHVPKGVMDRMIKKKVYKSNHIPGFVGVVVRILINILRGGGRVYYQGVENIVYFAFRSIRLKIKYSWLVRSERRLGG